jgi:hypothetical protein
MKDSPDATRCTRLRYDRVEQRGCDPGATFRPEF